jgi:hypothetical protein
MVPALGHRIAAEKISFRLLWLAPALTIWESGVHVEPLHLVLQGDGIRVLPVEAGNIKQSIDIAR